MTRSADKVEIAEQLARYSHAVDMFTFENLKSFFHPDAKASYLLAAIGAQDIHLVGQAAIVGFLSERMPTQGAPMPRHGISNIVIDFADDDTADLRAFLNPSGALCGYYRIRFVRTAAGWRALTFEVQNFRRQTPAWARQES